MNQVIIISEEDRNRLQRADTETASYLNIITHIIGNNMDISGERFAEYEKKYQQAFATFEAEKANLQRKYLSHCKASSWNLDYNTCELTYND